MEACVPDGRTLKEHCRGLIEKGLAANQAGFRAAKMEICIKGPYAHNGVQESDKAIIETVVACREALGADMTMMVDVAYAWRDAEAALRVIQEIAPLDIFFLETPLPTDDLEGYAFLADHSPIVYFTSARRDRFSLLWNLVMPVTAMLIQIAVLWQIVIKESWHAGPAGRIAQAFIVAGALALAFYVWRIRRRQARADGYETPSPVEDSLPNSVP